MEVRLENSDGYRCAQPILRIKGGALPLYLNITGWRRSHRALVVPTVFRLIHFPGPVQLVRRAVKAALWFGVGTRAADHALYRRAGV